MRRCLFAFRGCFGLAPAAALLGATVAMAEEMPVQIRFEAAVGNRALACGEVYEGIGAASAAIQPQDFRLYVSEVALLTATGERVPILLDRDEIWQNDSVALLDFEDASGSCNGTAAVNTSIRGHASAGHYTGLAFTIGVPEELNHADATIAESPLNYTSLYWGWRFGYLFMRLDMETASQAADGGSLRDVILVQHGQPGHGHSHGSSAAASGFSVHVGSVGCGGEALMDARAPEAPCAVPNRARFTLAEFDPAEDVVVFDIAALLADADVTVNMVGSVSGCMSTPDDSDCAAIMPRLGLPWRRKATTKHGRPPVSCGSTRV